MSALQMAFDYIYFLVCSCSIPLCATSWDEIPFIFVSNPPCILNKHAERSIKLTNSVFL